MIPHHAQAVLFAGWAAVGLLIYLLYSRGCSHLGRGKVEVHEIEAETPPQPVPPVPGQHH